MNRFLAIFFALACAVCAQDYNGSTTPTINDSDVILLRKIAKALNDSRTGSAALATSAGAQTITASVGNATLSTSFAALGSATAKQVTIINATGVAVNVRYGTGSAVILPDGAGYTFRGLSNASGLQVSAASGTPTLRYIIESW